MNTVTLYHGTNRGDAVVDALVGGGALKMGFHLTADKEVARNYGDDLVAVYLTSDLNRAHVGLINKENNHNKAVGNGIEYVVHNDAAMRELMAEKLWDAEVLS